MLFVSLEINHINNDSIRLEIFKNQIMAFENILSSLYDISVHYIIHEQLTYT